MSNCILVTDVPSSFTDDIIELYFENKRSGGGDVVSVKMDPERNSALVFFKNYKVVTSVLKRQHKICGEMVKVYPFNECIGYVVSKEQPVPALPESVSISVDTKIMDFIKSEDSRLEKLHEELLGRYGQIELVYGSKKYTIIIKPTISQNTPNVHEVVKTWPQDVRNAFDEYVQQFKTLVIPVSEGIWLQVKTTLQDTIAGQLVVQFDDGTATVILTGIAEEVQQAAFTIRCVIANKEKELEKQRLRSQETVVLNVVNIKQLAICQFQKNTANKYKGLAIKVDEEGRRISFDGLPPDIHRAKLEMFETFDQIYTLRISPPTTSLFEFLTCKAVSDRIYSTFNEKNIKADFLIEDGGILCIAMKEADAEKAKAVIRDMADEIVIRIPPNSTDVLRHRDWDGLLDKLKRNYSAKIKVCKDVSVRVKVTTFKTAKSIIEDELVTFLKMHTKIVETIKANRGKLEFLRRFKNSEFESLKQGKLREIEITEDQTGRLAKLTMKGTEDDINNAKQLLKKLLDSVILRQYTIRKPGMQQLFTQENGQSFLSHVEDKVICIIEITESADTLELLSEPYHDYVDDEANSYEDKYDADDDDDDILGASFIIPQLLKWNIRYSNYLYFTTSEGITIRLIEGNLANQTTDVIVNTIEEKCDLTTGAVSQAVLQAAGQELQNEIYSKRGNSVKEGDLIITGSGALKCKAVFHACVLGTPWDDGITAPKILQSVVDKCLKAANKNNMCSIAIPAMGTGFLGYPKDTTARIIYEEIVKFSKQYPGTTLRQVSVVVYDKDLPTFQAFKDEITKLRGISSWQRKLGMTHTSASSTTNVSPQSATKFKTAEGKIISLVKGSLANQKVDVILNTTNTKCELSTGVVSQAILKAAGPQLQKEFNKKKSYSRNEGDVIVTGGANLNCTEVFHLCMPGTSWDGVTDFKPFLRNILQKCFNIAHRSNMSSLALPALGTGALKYPRDIVADIIYDEACLFSKKHPNSALMEIIIVLYDKDLQSIKAFEDKMQEFRRAQIMYPPIIAMSAGSNWYKTSEGKTVRLIRGNIVTQQVDVIVNPILTSCKLETGVLPQAMLKAAGAELQVKLNEKKSEELKEGDVIPTRGCKLNCKRVYHACILDTKWDGGAKCEPLMRHVIQQCLFEADFYKMTSIAFPAIGTGGLEYPSDITARIMYEEINNFSKILPNSSLTDIRLIVFDKNLDVCKAFERAMPQAPVAINTVSEESTANSKTKRHEPRHSLYTGFKEYGKKVQLMVGNICVQAQVGDITDETNDAIVNYANEVLELGRGSVTQDAILIAAGFAIRIECKQLGKQKIGSVVMTGAGNLACKRIIHVILNPTNVEKMLIKVFQLAEDKNLQSISMPLLGTAEQSKKPNHHIRKLLEAAGGFCWKSIPQNLRKIRVIVDRSKDLDACRKVMGNFQGKPIEETKSLLKRIFAAIGSAVTSAFSSPKGEMGGTSGTALSNEVTFNIHADSKTNIVNAIQKIQKYINEEFAEQTIDKESVKHIEPEDLKIISKYAEQLYVKVDLQRDTSSTASKIVMKGLSKNVLQVQNKVDETLESVMEKINTEKKRKALAKNIKWMFQFKGEFKEYDETTTGIIEMAHEEKKDFIDFEIDGGQYRINFKKKIELNLNKPTSFVRVVRAEKGSISLPPEWEPMDQSKKPKSVTLDPKSSEYHKTVEYFKRTYTPNEIISIHRIQNEKFYLQYLINKQVMEAKYGKGKVIERRLYHGTSADTIDKINAGGFNRSFAGKNATYYGKGSYFAVEASYSVEKGFAARDDKGIMNIYIVRVLIGEYTLGDPNMVVPPAKDSSEPYDLYDSVVDDMNNPNMFVVFQDATAYPQYLIKFR